MHQAWSCDKPDIYKNKTVKINPFSTRGFLNLIYIDFYDFRQNTMQFHTIHNYTALSKLISFKVGIYLLKTFGKARYSGLLQIVLLHVYVRLANFTSKPRFQNLNLYHERPVCEGHRFDSCWENSEFFFRVACLTDWVISFSTKISVHLVVKAGLYRRTCTTQA